MASQIGASQVGWLVGGVKADCLTRYLGLCVECPPWGVFIRDPSPFGASQELLLVNIHATMIASKILLH